MLGIQKRYLSMFRRVSELLAAETANPTTAGPLSELETVISRMSEHGVTQDTLSRRTRSSTVNLGELALTIRRDLLRPARLAARTVLPVLGNGAGALRTTMRAPRNQRDLEALAVTTQAFANALDEHTTAFAAAGLPPEFAARMRSAAELLLKTIDTRSKELQRRVAATRGLEAESQRGIAIVRLLDALVEPALRADPARAAEWRKATRIRSFAAAGGTTGSPDAPTLPPTPTSTTEATQLAA